MTDAADPVEIPFRAEMLRLVQHGKLPELVRDAFGPEGRDAPHWACLWPSGRAMVGEVGARDDWSDLDVLELGCGIGPGAIAAAKAGARRVVAADLEPRAGAWVEANARRNGVTVVFRAFDWNEPPPDLGTFHRILASDVFYDDGMLRGVLRFLQARLRPAGRALITDPFRVSAAGVAGAARLRGLRAWQQTLSAGPSIVGGVQLFEFERSR
ncbi:MAG TPA: methyltransferase domain-containing protein [Myxococcales bacterium LLY-WYZ-16_1]|jgi:predicted nicotinamide N-methyase|nr:methyltransferase domain-containing protein [Myxococcales bacterium LLY-WYZ-16_1]